MNESPKFLPETKSIDAIARRAKGEKKPRIAVILPCRNEAQVIGTRIGSTGGQYRRLHIAGNRVFSFIFGRLFGHDIDDLLSGYRVFSRRFVKTFSARSHGFEIETKLAAVDAFRRDYL